MDPGARHSGMVELALAGVKRPAVPPVTDTRSIKHESLENAALVAFRYSGLTLCSAEESISNSGSHVKR
jgi:hypothetical protein